MKIGVDEMVVDKSRVDKLGCYSTNIIAMHITCTFKISHDTHVLIVENILSL